MLPHLRIHRFDACIHLFNEGSILANRFECEASFVLGLRPTKKRCSHCYDDSSGRELTIVFSLNLLSKHSMLEGQEDGLFLPIDFLLNKNEFQNTAKSFRDSINICNIGQNMQLIPSKSSKMAGIINSLCNNNKKYMTRTD